MNMAMSNSTGVARFSRECPSEEQCGLNVAAQRNSDLIDTSTVDAFLHKYDIASVDVLKVGWRQGVGFVGDSWQWSGKSSLERC